MTTQDFHPHVADAHDAARIMAPATTPLADALGAAIEAAKAAEEAYQGSEEGSPEETALKLVADQADDAVEAARTALAKSDEERTWQLTEEGEGYDTEKAGSAAEALDIARDNVDRDNYGYSNDQRTLYVDVRVNCEATGEEAEATVALEPDEPECGEREGHDWKSPWSVLGGLKENPGAWGHGGGVVVKEVCAHCGRYRVTDTWAQRRDTGVQGLTEVKYEDADETSSEWVASLAGDAE